MLSWPGDPIGLHRWYLDDDVLIPCQTTYNQGFNLVDPKLVSDQIQILN